MPIWPDLKRGMDVFLIVTFATIFVAIVAFSPIWHVWHVWHVSVNLPRVLIKKTRCLIKKKTKNTLLNWKNSSLFEQQMQLLENRLIQSTSKTNQWTSLKQSAICVSAYEIFIKMTWKNDTWGIWLNRLLNWVTRWITHLLIGCHDA